MDKRSETSEEECVVETRQNACLVKFEKIVNQVLINHPSSVFIYMRVNARGRPILLMFFLGSMHVS